MLVNSNPATIMTDPEIADRTYIEPLVPEILEAVIARERPDALLPTLGGQTGLNLAMKLHETGVLERYGVEMIGANATAIATAEDRGLFRAAMTEIGLAVPDSGFAYKLEEALEVGERVGFPGHRTAVVHIGGRGTGIATTARSLEIVAANGLDASPISEILIERSIAGWKEYELEVMRDRADNCVIVCSIENFDPMGVHTGDSITVAPAQTLIGCRVPADARRRLRLYPAYWRGDRRVQYSVRHQPGQRGYGRYRNEPQGVAFERAGLEGDRVPDSEDRRPLGRGLHAGRNSKRHNWRNAGEFRTHDRLRRDQGPSLGL